MQFQESQRNPSGQEKILAQKDRKQMMESSFYTIKSRDAVKRIEAKFWDGMWYAAIQCYAALHIPITLCVMLGFNEVQSYIPTTLWIALWMGT